MLWRAAGRLGNVAVNLFGPVNHLGDVARDHGLYWRPEAETGCAGDMPAATVNAFAKVVFELTGGNGESFHVGRKFQNEIVHHSLIDSVTESKVERISALRDGA